MKKIVLGLLMFFAVGCTKDEVVVAPLVPLAPTELNVTNILATQVNLSWTDNSTNETGFKIQRKGVTGNYVTVGTVGADVTLYEDKGLTINTAYSYRVMSYNYEGESNGTEFSFTTINTTITIGTQTWTTTNLDVATYSDGTVIPQVTDPTEWLYLTTGAWCYYKNDPANGATYGKLYNWYAVAGIWNDASNTDATQRKKLAPTGYHVPSNDEWTTLITYLGGEFVAGGKMKATGITWVSPNVAATNESGFTGLPGGLRFSKGGDFNAIYGYGYWWSSTDVSIADALSYTLYCTFSDAYRSPKSKGYGFSVRCIKD
jgi:uncharacterized protein (TIGR02145 family)